MEPDDLLATVGYLGTTCELPLRRLGDETSTTGMAVVAEEVPVSLVYNGRPHVVVMATPADLEDLAYGFSLTESIVSDIGEIEQVEVVKASHGIEVQVRIPTPTADALEARARSLAERTC